MAAQWQVGDRIQNRWQIDKIHGGFRNSGFGIVYVVYDHELREVFAAKTFQEEAFAKNPGTAESFIREAHAWVNLDIHQNVTRARFVQEIEGKPFLFLEYVSGGDLKGWIGTPRLTDDLPQALRFAIQFCDGMIHALSKGIKVHRDIKPENCLVTEDRTLKVTDFGLAKVFDDASPGERKEERSHEEKRVGGLGVVLSRTGYAAGTPHYMAPEQFEDYKHVDVRADVYSFGVMLFQMVTGQLPFRGGRSLEEWKQLHKATPVPVRDGRLSAVNAVVQRCLAKAPEQRFADFGAVREGLAQIYETLTGRAPALPASAAELKIYNFFNKGVSLSNLGRPEEAVVCYDRALEIDPRYVVAWNGNGDALQKLGRPGEALVCFDRALEINPRFEDAWNNKGVALEKLGRPEEAVVCYDRALEINPRYESAWTGKGNALTSLGRRNEAVVCYDRAVDINPRYELGWYNKAIVLNNLGRPEEALVCYDRALEINPRYVAAWSNKGIVLDKLGRPEEALVCHDRALEIDARHVVAWNGKGNALKDALGRPEEALVCYDRALEINPRFELGWYNKAIVLNNLGRPEEALVCYDRALEINPRYEYAWNNKGNALNSLARRDEAVVCYDRALGINPRYELAWINKGIVLDKLGPPEEALACYDRALDVNPRNSEVWIRKGNALNKLGRMDEALICYDHALEVNPGYELARNNKGIVLTRLGRLEEALACYDGVLKINPRNELASKNRRIVLNKLERPEEALACYDAALDLNPRNSEVWTSKGNALNKLGRMDEALICYDHALEINPDYELPRNNKGVVLYGLGRLEEALACYDGVLKINPRYELAWNGKGDVLYGLGRPEEALACYDLALDVNPRNELAWNNRVNVLTKLGRSEEAFEDYDGDPQYEAAWKARGDVLYGLGRSEEAQACYDHALDLQLNPRSLQDWTSKGNALNELGRMDEALMCYDRALDLACYLDVTASDPRYQLAWTNKGIVLNRLGRLEEALACYDGVLKINPRNELACKNRPIVLSKLAHPQEAPDPRNELKEAETGTMAIRISYDYQGTRRIFEPTGAQVIIGRPDQGIAVDLDLTPDLAVSRRHARVWLEGGHGWIEDLGSTRGTLISGRDIKGQEKKRLEPDATIQIGNTTLKVEFVEDSPGNKAPEAQLEIGQTMAPDVAAFASPADANSDVSRRLSLLYELPLQFAEQPGLELLLQRIVEQLVGIIPGAARGAVLLRNRSSNKLLLKAHVPLGEPAISMTLAQRAMEKSEGFIWRRSEEVTPSMTEYSCMSGMYAPLVWKDEVLGVVCVDNPSCRRPFDEDDLRLLLAVVRYAAMAVANCHLQEEMHENAALLARLLTNFSPRIQETLLKKAHHGKLRLGGERSEVTILCSDIRGFTRMSATMDASDVVDMLNDYFAALVNAIFRYDGTVDKFVGDAILAVFGSPEPDAKQHENATRAALEMQASVEKLNEERHARGLVTCDMGIAIHCGEVIHGFIGSAERMEFTVIGDTVNKTARYCDGAQAGEILISPEMHQHIWKVIQAESVLIPTKHERNLHGYRLTGWKQT